MEYKKGTIVYVWGTVFEDSNKLDETGHPAFIPIASDDITGETYYLLLTSNVARLNIAPEMYYDLTEVYEEVHLPKPSLINLSAIYKKKISNDKLGGLAPNIFKDVIRHLKDYQNSNPSRLYDEVKGKL